MRELLRKLSSRKLWAAVAGIVTGLAMVFGLDENTISTVAGAVVPVASVLTYIITEGKIDAEGVKKAVEDTQKAVEAVSDADVLAIARGELGYTESPQGSNKNKYGRWYGLGGEPWCMMFVQWCCAQAGVNLPARTASCGAMMRAAQAAGCWVTGTISPAT